VRRDRGYTMVILLVGMTAMAVLIAAVLPLASAETQRDKEEELIFRGLQYAEGCRLFKVRYGRYPNALKEMHEMRPRTIRKLWKDPITNSLDWGIITATTGAPLPGQLPGGAPPGGSQKPGFSPSPAPTPSPTPGFGAPPGATPIGPILGVYSKSTKKSYKVYQGRDTYADWRFDQQTFLGPSGAPGPGGPNRPPGPGVVN